jgi:hypothetical protein
MILLANSLRGVLRGEKYNRREKQEERNVPKPAEKHGNTRRNGTIDPNHFARRKYLHTDERSIRALL